MQEKYYTHFVLSETDCSACGEFTGVIEINRATRMPLDLGDVQQILADNLEVDRDEVTILQCARLH